MQGNERMQKSFTGGCQCGAVRYELTGAPERLYACHCKECQRQTGSAFGMTLLVKENGLKISGELKKFERISDAGNRVTAYFCPNCGVRIYGIPRYVKGLFSLKPGTLDDTSWLRPTAMLWLKSAQSWCNIPDDVERNMEQ